MAERYKVIWSGESKDNVDAICNFLIEKWSIKERDNFLDLLIHFEKTISAFPKAFKASPKNKKWRLGLIHRNSTAIYTIKSL